MEIELTLTCNRLGAIELLEETGFWIGMLWQRIIVEVSHAQRPPPQRLSSNAVGLVIDKSEFPGPRVRRGSRLNRTTTASLNEVGVRHLAHRAP